MLRILFILLFWTNIVVAQRQRKADKIILHSLKQDISYLASDELKGRRAGDSGEIQASAYISSKFKSLGLIPKGTDGYYQPFTIYEGKEIGSSSFFRVAGKELTPMVDFFPLSNSVSSESIAEEVSPELKETHQPWIIDLSDSLEQSKSNPHFDVSVLINDLLNSAKSKGATGVIFYNSKSPVDLVKFDPKDRTTPTPIPAIYITSKAQVEHFADPSLTYFIEYAISLSPKVRSARNVLGYIDNNAPLTIVLGAHFDHLGYGEDGNSMIRTGTPDIHNGADDNASGTAAIIELASQLSTAKEKKFNYLFVAFSAEELGLYGSKYYVDNPTIPLSSINYMINLDMVGRLNDSTKSLNIGGYGTSPSWQTMIESINNKSFSIRFDSSGSGPSDHTSFYRKDIPVLFFFTGLHSDYHKPSDDAEKINYWGTLQIIKFIKEMILSNGSIQKIAFTKTKEQQTTTSARFSVSLGIMPDYSYSGNGVRADGVSENRPAKKAGLLPGDVIVKLGSHSTSSVESYMQALSKFKKGEQTTVIVLRGDKEITFEIVF